MQTFPRLRTLALALLALLVITPVLTSAAGGWTNKTSALRKAIVNRHPKNVILLIGDGMGDSDLRREPAPGQPAQPSGDDDQGA